MAKETITRLKDDLDGSEARTTIRFSWDGTAYEIDLNAQNSRAFEEAVGPYLAVSRRVSGTRSAKKPAAKQIPAAAKHDLAAVRVWAASNGTAVASRGRIAATVIEAYHEAQNAVNTVVPSQPAAKPTRRAPVKKAPTNTTATRTGPVNRAAVKKAPVKKATPRKAAARKNASKSTGRKTVARKTTAATPAAASASE